MFSINRLLLLFKQITKLHKLDMMGKALGFYEEIAHFLYSSRYSKEGRYIQTEILKI